MHNAPRIAGLYLEALTRYESLDAKLTLSSTDGELVAAKGARQTCLLLGNELARAVLLESAQAEHARILAAAQAETIPAPDECRRCGAAPHDPNAECSEGLPVQP